MLQEDQHRTVQLPSPFTATRLHQSLPQNLALSQRTPVYRVTCGNVRDLPVVSLCLLLYQMK